MRFFVITVGVFIVSCSGKDEFEGSSSRNNNVAQTAQCEERALTDCLLDCFQEETNKGIECLMQPRMQYDCPTQRDIARRCTDT